MEHYSTGREPLPLTTVYAALPKNFGETSTDVLLKVGGRAQSALDETPETHTNSLVRAHYHEIIADTYLEAGLATADSTHSYDDERLQLVDDALEHYNYSINIREERMSTGFDDPDSMDDLLRLRLRTGFEQAYKDIVCGEITEQTRDEILDFLQTQYKKITRTSRAIRKGINKGYYPQSYHQYLSNNSGVQAEIQYLESIWQNINNNQLVIAFPSTTRGGSGNVGILYKISRDTHDVVLAAQIDNIWQFQPIEVKRISTYKKARQDLGRYASEIALVGEQGDVRLLSDVETNTRFAS